MCGGRKCVPLMGKKKQARGWIGATCLILYIPERKKNTPTSVFHPYLKPDGKAF